MRSPATENDREVVIRHRTVIADEVVELVFEAADGGTLPRWDPGAHIDLVLDPGTVRQYSLCGDPADRRRYRVAVLREVDGRGGSVRIHEKLSVGKVVTIRGPRNHFPLEEHAAYVFLAGGIGITPLLPMIRQVERAGSTWELHYAGRTRGRMAYFAELVVPGRPAQAVVSSEEGRIDVDAILASAVRGSIVYCCGPASLIAAAEDAAARHGLAFRAEHFVPKEIHGAVDAAFTVRLAASEIDVEVPAGRSLLDALLDADIAIPTSCGEGTCGTCEVTVLAGVPDHRDSILTADEQSAGDRMYVCVSRSRSATLVLDL
ncbi:MAG: Ferredoxin [Pseudonocardiales bacterium]|nr:Ferredoxin [Pseudonocardiales bacterium]